MSLSSYAGSLAYAADYTFAPEGCEFRMDFPEEPLIARTCSPKDKNKCHTVARFNQVYDLESGIYITVTCNDAEPGMMERYSGDVMQYTMGAMAKKYIDEESSQTAFQDIGTAKQALIMGSKKQPDGHEDIFMGQLWIGKKSVFSIEGQITGKAPPEADTLFAHTMKSVRPVTMDKPAEKPAPDDAAPQKETPEKP